MLPFLFLDAMMDNTKIQPQKIIIEKDGTIQIDWANPAFSDVIFELYSKEKKEEVLKTCKDPSKYKIWCG